MRLHLHSFFFYLSMAGDTVFVLDPKAESFCTDSTSILYSMRCILRRSLSSWYCRSGFLICV